MGVLAAASFLFFYTIPALPCPALFVRSSIIRGEGGEEGCFFFSSLFLLLLLL